MEAMTPTLAAAFADASTRCEAWLATAQNDYEAMSKADASAMEQYRISHDGRTHIEHHALLADLFTAFFALFRPGCAPAAASAAPAASSAPATAAAPAASAAPTASGPLVRLLVLECGWRVSLCHSAVCASGGAGASSAWTVSRQTVRRGTSAGLLVVFQLSRCVGQKAVVSCLSVQVVAATRFPA